MKLEEREVMIRRITLQCEELQRENTQILTENGRLIDTVSVLEMSLTEVKMHGSREMNVLAPRVQELEYSTEALVGKVKRNTLDVDLMAGLVRKHLKTATQLSTEIKLKAKIDLKASEDLAQTKSELYKMSKLAMRRGRVASIAMSACRTVQNEKKQGTDRLNKLWEGTTTLHLQTEAKQAIIDTQIAQIQRLRRKLESANNRTEECADKSALLQIRYEERNLEFEILQRRFEAMFENGMTAEKQKEFATVKLNLHNARAHTKEQHQKIQELEARIFELELTMGSSAPPQTCPAHL
jgi:hypothetical protein